jgi:hypothetical protein
MKLNERIFSWNNAQGVHRIMIFIISALCLYNFIFGEKFPADGGLTWSGIRYAEMVRHLDSMISGGLLSEYHAQRVLPSAIIRSMLLFTETSMSDQHIIRGFELYNSALLIGACFVWKRIANKMSLSISGRLIGFSGIFINFAISKHSFYVPVMTDVSALFVAMLLLLFFLEKKPVSLFLVTVIGAFCWPVVSICGAFLLVFLDFDYSEYLKRSSIQMDIPKKNIYFDLLKFISFVLSGLAVIFYLTLKFVVPIREYVYNVIANHLQSVRDLMPSNHGPNFFYYVQNGNNQFIAEQIIQRVECFLSALPALSGLFIAIIILIGHSSFIQVTFTSLIKTRLLLWLLGIFSVLIPKVIVILISNPNIPNASGLSNLIWYSIFSIDGEFLLPLVSLVTFWGPVVLLLFLYWKEFSVEARKFGPGFIAVIGLHLFLGLTGEPRFFTIGWPFFVLAIVQAMESSERKKSFKYVFIILTILYAQFWLRINYAPWLSSDTADMFVLPKQLYFMHIGSFMSWWSYFMQFIALIVSAILLQSTINKIGSEHKCTGITE